MSYFIIGGTNVMVGQMSYVIIGGTNVGVGQMSYVVIGGTNVRVGQTSVGQTSVALVSVGQKSRHPAGKWSSLIFLHRYPYHKINYNFITIGAKGAKKW
jgi:hypothetical protein